MKPSPPSSTPFPPPSSADIGDHGVLLENNLLSGKKIALVVTGGIAAYLSPSLARLFRKWGAAQVVPVLTHEANRYVAREALEWACDHEVITQLSYQAEHLSHKTPFDAYVIAPATYNFINSFRYGVASSPALSLMATALGQLTRGKAQIFIAPTMHGQMHTPILEESVSYLQSLGVGFIPPRDLYGKHNLPDLETIVAEVARGLNSGSLSRKKVLVTAGSIPTWIDDVRVMTNLFRGTLGIRIAQELYLKGADVQLVVGPSHDPIPKYLPYQQVSSFEDYEKEVLRIQNSHNGELFFSIHVAAVADYRSKTRWSGKLSSQELTFLELESTPKVVDQALENSPPQHLISFKYQLKTSVDKLLEIANQRLLLGHRMVVANAGDELGPMGEQVAYLCWGPQTGQLRPQFSERVIGKTEIAKALVDKLAQLAL